MSSLETSSQFWFGLLSRLGYAQDQQWGNGISFRLQDAYIVLVQVAPEHMEPSYHRQRVGLNHLAFHAASRAQVDQLTDWVRQCGYRVLYEDRHPFAGVPQTYALYCEDPDRIKVEVVAPT